MRRIIAMLSYPIQLGFGAASYVQNSGNTCTLNNGKATATVTVQVKPAAVPNAPVIGQATFTVNFIVNRGETVTVTPPDTASIIFTGDTAYKEKLYSGLLWRRYCLPNRNSCFWTNLLRESTVSSRKPSRRF